MEARKCETYHNEARPCIQMSDKLTFRRFIHCITKQRSTLRPDEKGGGVLADEMGMGKSLAVLALIIRTLDRAHQWVEVHRSDEPSYRRTHTYSHSTLVIVPSACKFCLLCSLFPFFFFFFLLTALQVLINSWESEIKTCVP